MRFGDPKSIHFLTGASATDAVRVQQCTNCIKIIYWAKIIVPYMRLGDPKSIHFLTDVSATDAIHVQQCTNCIKRKTFRFGDKYVAKLIYMWCVFFFFVCVRYVGL